VVSNIFSMGRIASLLLMAFLLTVGAPSQFISQSNQAAHLVEVGTHKMFLNCTGKAAAPTVILAGKGDTSEVWSAVQTELEKFAIVCSYDRLGLGCTRGPLRVRYRPPSPRNSGRCI
jgi:hypothetical protein